jgi:hypothetical protein
VTEEKPVPVYGGDDCESGRSRDEARSGEHHANPLDLFCHRLTIGALPPVQESGDPAERGKDEEKVLPRKAGRSP